MVFLLKKNKLLLSILMFPYLLILIIGTVRTNNELVVVAQITPVVNTVSINNGNTTQLGSFNTVPVWVIRRPTILQSVYGRWSNNNDVFEISPAQSHLSISQMNQIGEMNHLDSVHTSLILAYEAAAEHHDANVFLAREFEGLRVTFPSANTQMQIGDLITEINSISSDNENFINEFYNRQAGTTIQITRNGQKMSITLTENDIWQPDSSSYGFNAMKVWNFFPELSTPSFQINIGNTQGASGGLMQTLSLLNALIEEDLTGGFTIAGTGTINFNGRVGAIGGVRQKVIAAYRAGADIFFIGYDNYEEAQEAWTSIGRPNNMSLQLVVTLEDAIYYLRNRI